MGEWWQGLSALNQWFYGVAAFFSVFFVWQVIAAFVGLGGGEEVDGDVDADVDTDADVATDADGHSDAYTDADAMVDSSAHHAADAGVGGGGEDTILAFKLLSIRSIIAFCTLFTWAGALYINQGLGPSLSITYALGWGVAGMVAVAGLMHLLLKLTETGTPKLRSCLGREGKVYLNIPADGEGEVRVTVSGAMTHVRARSAGGHAIDAGTPVRVVSLAGRNAVRVEPAGPPPAREA